MLVQDVQTVRALGGPTTLYTHIRTIDKERPIPERGGGVLGEVATDKWVAGARRVWEACTTKYNGRISKA
jgi:hypothetical protein